MNKFLSKFARLSAIEKPTKKRPFTIYNVDENGVYIKELIKYLKNFPKLTQLSLPGFSIKRLAKIDPTDVIVFGDALSPRKYDYRVVELEDVLNTDGYEQYELPTHWKEIKKAIRAYHKANYPKDHKRLKQQGYYYTTPSLKQRRRKVTPPCGFFNNLEFEVSRKLLKKIRNREVEVQFEIPVKKRHHHVPVGDIYYEPKKQKKASGKQYVVHQNFVKAGLTGYNIYQNKYGEEHVNISGKKYGVVRRSGRKDYLVEA